MKTEDLIEVHVHDNGRWRLEERFRAAEKDEAIAAAKRLITKGSEAVKVVRETFDEATGLFKERTLYREGTPKPKQPEAKAAPRPQAAVSRTAVSRNQLASPAAAPGPKAESGRQARPLEEEPIRIPLGHILSRVALMTTGVLALGGIGGVVLMEQFGLGMVLPGRYLTFAVALLVAAFVLALFLFARTKRLLEEQALMRRRQAAEAAKQAAPPATLSEVMAMTRAGEEVPEGASAASGAQPSSAASPEPDWAARLDAALSTKKAEKTEAAREAPAPDPAPPPVPAAPVAPAPSVSAVPSLGPQPNDPMALPVASEQDRVRLRDFFKNCLTGDGAKIFTDNGPDGKRKRFACHLFLLGAGEAVMQAAGQAATPPQLGAVLQMALAMLGTTPQRATEFAAKVDDYRNDALYADTISAGRLAMQNFINGKGIAGDALGQALKLWGAQETKAAAAQQAPTGDVAIMFTDMVSSVETTQALGDEGAMRLVQAHNLIVGAALKRHRGHQVKHTGDGIMAVFPRVSDAVKASAEIQREVNQYNTVTLQRPLAIRIGVSSGKPVQEDNDYFGTVVQLAARLSGAGEPGAIHVTQGVAEQSPADGFSYGPLSLVPLKGFPEPQPAIQVHWRGSIPTEAAE